MRRLLSLVRALLRRRTFEEEMTEELRFHVDQYAADLVRAGATPADAMRQARMALGSTDNVKADCRRARGLRLFDNLLLDLRYAGRLMRKEPAFTSTVLATIAICLGANLTIFAVVDAVLLRPLPFPAADRLVRIFNTYPKAGVPDDGSSLTNYYERRGRIRAFASLSIYKETVAIVGEPGTTARETIMRVSPEFFATLGNGPILGRAFTEAETTFQTDKVVIVSDAYWRRMLNADPGVLGRTLRMDGFERTIVGVLPPDFRFLSSTSRLYVPLSSDPERRTADKRHWGSQGETIARLAPGVSRAEAQAQIDAHNAAVEANGPDAARMAAAGFRSMVVGLHADHVAAARPALLLVQAGALCLLLIGAVNLANMLLVRAAGRVREFAVRQAIGAGRRDIVREVMVETLVLALAGGLLGLVVGAVGVEAVARLGADRLPLGTYIGIDGRVALAAIAGAIGIGVVIGAPIAWYNLRQQAVGALHAQSRSSTANRTMQRARHGFLVAQTSLAFVLLTAAGLLGISLEHVMARSPGFRPGNVLSGRISLPWTSYQNGGARLAFTEHLIDRLRGQPGMVSAGITTNVPMSGSSGKSAATIAGRGTRRGESPHGIYSYGVGGDYFDVTGIPLREGRLLAASDARRPERVCVIDEDFARRNFPRGNAIGQRLFMGGGELSPDEAFTIVGIVGPVKQAGLTDDARQGAVYYPYPYWDDGEIFVVVRSALPLESLGTGLQQAVRFVDPDLPVADIQWMDRRIADSLLTRRSPAVLAGLFSAIALLLTAVGTYGVVSYAVSQRRREIGLRIALGARPGQVRRHFVSLAARLVALGTVLGAAGSWAAGGVMQTVLFEVPALHLPTLAGTALVVTVACTTACVLSSRRAARISPVEVLNSE